MPAIEPSVTWMTVAILEPNWHQAPMSNESHQVVDNIWIGRLPAWLLELPQDDVLRTELRNELEDEWDHCFFAQYAAPPSSSGAAADYDTAPEETAQRATVEAMQRAVLALWLVRPSSLSLTKFIHAELRDNQWVWRHLLSFDGTTPLHSYRSVELVAADFQAARPVASALAKLDRQGALRTASSSLQVALLQRTWSMRFLALWQALEGLFGPTDGREITFRLSQRMALFLESDSQSAVSVFRSAKSSYGWRSKAVHGMRVGDLPDATAAELLEEAERLVRRALLNILHDDKLVTLFEGKARESYLDELAFGRRG